MKTISLLFLSALIFSDNYSVAQSDFWYDKNTLEAEFRFVDSLHHPLLNKMQPPDSSEFTLYDLELEPFCSGLCCGPFCGIKYKDESIYRNSERQSYLIGCSGFAVGTVVVLYVLWVNYGFYYY